MTKPVSRNSAEAEPSGGSTPSGHDLNYIVAAGQESPQWSRRKLLKFWLAPLALAGLGATARARAKGAIPTIVIDAGHGGHDSGAVGSTGVLEKSITLKVALMLRDELEGRSGHRVVLTRDDDVFLPLIDRVRIAQSNDAHLLISLHADALTDATVRGASIYTLSPDASDAQTAELAASHNSETATGPLGRHEHPPEVSVILESLMFREKQRFSAQIQQTMVDALEPVVPLLKNPARHGHFLVLRTGSIPSLLLEMGFLSNPDDERLVMSDYHQRGIVDAARVAIDRHIRSFVAAASAG